MIQLMNNTTERIRKYLAQRPGVDARKAAKNMGVTVSEVRAAQGNTVAPVAAPPGNRVPSKSVKLLRIEFDDVGKVVAAMKAMPRGDYIDDTDLRRSLRISEPRWREVKAHPSLADFQMLLPNKKVVWMHESAQSFLRAAIDISQQ